MQSQDQNLILLSISDFNMNKKQHIVTSILWWGLILMLLIPAIQHFTGFANEKKLEGSFTETLNPTFNDSMWFSGAYQKQKQQYVNEQFGFRPDFVRIHNQVYYMLYNQALANDVIVGKEKYLYGKTYIDSYLGNDFLGEEFIQKQIKKLKAIKDTLGTKNIDLVMVLAPGKASFYPEFLPKRFVKKSNQPTNYKELKKQLKTNEINTLDFYSWFLQMKDTAAYPLFPKTGIHWSKYGEFRAADSLLGYVAKLRNCPMPWLDTFGFEVTTDVRDTDDDIEKGMNIITDIPDLKMGYFFSQIQYDSTKQYPKVSVIGDSYYWGLVALGLSEKGFNKGEFWYYFNERHFTDGTPMQGRHDLSKEELVKALESNQVIILLATNGNLTTFDFGFIDHMHEIYFGKEGSKD